MNSRKLFFILSIIALGAFLSSFVCYESNENTPGTITFIGDAGSPNVFTCNKWQFTRIEMPEDKVENLHVELEINTSAISTSWKKLENSIKKKKDYFYIKKFPKATVIISGATANADGTYTAPAQLSLKGITQTVPLTFTISNEKPYVVKGSGIVQRRAFNFYDDGPKDEVPVNFEVTLETLKSKK